MGVNNRLELGAKIAWGLETDQGWQGEKPVAWGRRPKGIETGRNSIPVQAECQGP